MKLWESTREPNEPDNEGPCLLIGDFGGTNARFALADARSPGFSHEHTLQCADYESAESAIHAYLKKVRAPSPDIICIAAAGPKVDGNIRITNNNWTLRADELGKKFGDAKVRLLNDFEAVALSIPFLSQEDCIQVGMPALTDLERDDYVVGIVGPGTGLGAAGLIKREGVAQPIIGEGGHVGFAAETQEQMEVLAWLRDGFDRVCDERLVSGPGISNLYQALAGINDIDVVKRDAADIFALAAERADDLAQEAVELFFEVLGQVAGNLALTIGAFDGVFIGGGIVARKPELILHSRFRAGFERKGRHRSLLEQTPTQVISHPNPGLLGAASCALEMNRTSA